nr:MAG TPA: hypothetical protein [Caudoviricetes sp.]
MVKYALSIKVTSDILSAVCGNEKKAVLQILLHNTAHLRI